MSTLAWVLIVIVVVILVIIIVILFIFGLLFGSAYAIQTMNEVIDNAWAYWEEKKIHKWDDLSEEEQEKILRASMIIEDDCGSSKNIDEIREMLKEQLPILEPHVGLTHTMSSDDTANLRSQSDCAVSQTYRRSVCRQGLKA